MVLDRSEDLDGLPIGLVGRGVVATRVSGGGGDPQRVGLLAVVAEIGQPLLGTFSKTEGLLGIAFLESDACTQDIDDRAHAKVAGEGGAFAAPVDGLASSGHVAVFELDR